MIGKAGWPRMTRDGIDYRLHDYGTVEPGHAFTYWPGFSLNPALWDVRRLQCAFFESFGEPPVFNSTDARFEQSFSSLRCRDSRGLFAARLLRAHGRGPDGLPAEQLHAALRRAGGRGLQVQCV